MVDHKSATQGFAPPANFQYNDPRVTVSPPQATRIGRYAAGQLCDRFGEVCFVIWESVQRGFADIVTTSLGLLTCV